ncbi:regulatory protein RecX [Jiella marina]|uniref:regulatory protein RecX n=1 Tax=Jiella sp. LLJ827 TaxID=2917712 RepID=UPI002100F0B5|nr:RecX family transcriptional regulator [Jiella sp. LLJ827]
MARTKAEESKPKPVTEDWLLRSAFHYLERYAASSDGLRRVMRRRAARRVGGIDQLPADLDAMLDALIARLVELNLLDDKAFAEAKLASLRRRGTSRALAAAKLQEKGVPRALIDETLANEESGEAEAAAAYVRRRRFGPYRNPGRGDRRDKEIAAMVRAGFPLRLAVAAIDGELEVGPGQSDASD